MGKLIDGVWVTDDVAAAGPDGQWRRAESVLRAWVTEDGPYRPEPGRYHLYAAWNCPWAHRALILRAVMGLEEAIGVSFARPRRTDQGWVFSPPGSGDGFEDALFGSAALHQVYTRAEPGYTGRVTVPVLFDEQTGRIVSNESSEIARMFGTVFRPLGTRDAEPVPDGRVAEIDAWNARIHRDLNNGVYRAGFASTQAA